MPRKVSVVVPSYNHAQFLEARLESVFKQTFTDFEIILLDDASTDGSAAILGRYAERPGVRLELNHANSGSPFKQWNKGVGSAFGEYVWIAESDDVADARFLERLVAVLDGDPRLGLAYCASRYISADGVLGELTPGSSRNFDETRWRADFTAEGKVECRRHLAFRSTIPNASAVLFRKSAYLSAGCADEQMRLCGDWFMWVKILQDWNLAYLAEPLNFFRVPHASSQRVAAARKRLPIEEWLKVITFIQERLTVPEEVRRESKYYLAQVWLEYLLYGEGWGRRKIDELRTAFAQCRRYDSEFLRHLFLVPWRQGTRGTLPFSAALPSPREKPGKG